MERVAPLSALTSLCGGVSIFAADRPISASEWPPAVDVAQTFLPLPAAAPEIDAPAAAAEAAADRPPACPSGPVAAARRGSSFMALAADVACAVGALTQQFPDLVAVDADAVRVAEFESQHIHASLNRGSLSVQAHNCDVSRKKLRSCRGRLACLCWLLRLRDTQSVLSCVVRDVRSAAGGVLHTFSFFMRCDERRCACAQWIWITCGGCCPQHLLRLRRRLHMPTLNRRCARLRGTPCQRS